MNNRIKTLKPFKISYPNDKSQTWTAGYYILSHCKTAIMKRILVPTDFSPNAVKALDYAAHLAKAAKAGIILIHAAEAYDQQEAMAAARIQLELVEKSLEETEGIPVTSTVYADSSVNSIIAAVTAHKADLIVMGTVGSTGINERIFGSRTAVVIGKTPVPVLAIPLLSEWKKLQKILLAINKFDVPEQLLAPVLKMAAIFDAVIQVTVFTDLDDDYVEDYDEHEKSIIRFRDTLQEKYPRLEIHAVHLAGKYFRETLQKWINENNVDMLVMLTHRRTLIGSVFNSSMTKKMSYHTNIPLLAIPESA